MGVKSLGWENSTAQESPIQSWKRILPSVVWASKSGAVSPICSAMTFLRGIQHIEARLFIWSLATAATSSRGRPQRLTAADWRLGSGRSRQVRKVRRIAAKIASRPGRLGMPSRPGVGRGTAVRDSAREFRQPRHLPQLRHGHAPGQPCWRARVSHRTKTQAPATNTDGRGAASFSCWRSQPHRSPPRGAEAGPKGAGRSIMSASAKSPVAAPDLYAALALVAGSPIISGPPRRPAGLVRRLGKRPQIRATSTR